MSIFISDWPVIFLVGVCVCVYVVSLSGFDVMIVVTSIKEFGIIPPLQFFGSISEE